MSTRRNGGIIGPQNRTSSVSSVGIWHLDDNQQSVGARNWYGVPPAVPNAPAVGTVTLSGNTATIPFTLGGTGGSPITSVTAITYPGGTLTTVSGSPPTSPITVTGLTPGTYYFAVYATNAVGNSSYNISNTVNIVNMNYLVVAGGAGGGYFSGGGGGAGGTQAGNVIVSTGLVMSVTVGSGGSGSGSTGNNLSSGSSGTNSIISGSGITTITASGGGGGASLANASSSGGSGGGGSPLYAAASGTAGQGYAGGSGGNLSAGYYTGGGGGGAGAIGGSATTTPGAGGSGLSSSITGSSVTYAGGGGGAGTSYIPLGGTSLNGSSAYLSITSGMSNYQFGTGDFTIECWVNKSGNGTSGYDGLIQLGTGTGGSDGYYFEISTSRGVYFTINGGVVSTGTWSNDGLWHHMAVVRSSGTVTIYKDGTSIASGSLATSVPTTATSLNIGRSYPSYYFNGLVTNLRILKGTAQYTSNFTPPTSPLTAITNCTLLTCLTAGFYDASTVNATINQNGSPALTYTSPFSPQTSTISGASGGSGGGGTGGGYNGNATSGTVNTGGGGGGGGYLSNIAASGGSGVVILSLPTSAYSGNTTGSPTVTTSGGNTVIKFTGNGSYTV